MNKERQLKYISSEQMFEGIIVEVHDAGVVIDIKGRLGQLKIPRRMIISNYDLEVGQEVGFLMTYPEVFDGAPNEHYAKTIKEYNERVKRFKDSQEENVNTERRTDI